MTVYYLNNEGGTGDDTSDGLSWDNALATLEHAIESHATSNGDIILVDLAHSESLSADATITPAANIRIICVDKDNSNALATGAVIGAQSTNYFINISAGKDVYIYGLTFRVGTGSTSKYLAFGAADQSHFELESCTLDLTTTNAGGLIYAGANTTSSGNSYNLFRNCTFKFGATGQGMVLAGCTEFIGGGIDAAGSSPTTLIKGSTAVAGVDVSFDGVDLSKMGSNTLIADFATGGGRANFQLRNCTIGAGMVFAAAQTTVLNKGGTSVLAFNCNSGDTHYAFYHLDPFGSTTAVATYYADDGAVCNGANVSYKVITTANCSFYTPYTGPWIAKAQTTTGSAVTPSFEGLRVDSTTIIQNDEVWGEWSFQGTSGYTQAEFTNDRQNVGARAAATAATDQTSAKAYSDWTGSPTDTDSGDSTFKLVPASSITPDEVGFIYGRVVVGEPSLTIYYDPQVRVA